MIIDFTYGFKHDGVLYWWSEKKLYRLPQMLGKRFYPLLELNKWKDKGYYIARQKKSFKQLKSMTIFINQKIEVIESEDLPF